MLVAHLPADSHTVRALKGEDVSWSRTDHLLAGLFDLLHVLVWQNANVGRKSPSRRPEPLPRPGVEADGQQQHGTPLPLERVKALLASTRPRVIEAGEVSGDGR